ncbi:MAG: winged helix-turn-helix transcriptional regulator [Pseudomonadales bacterium]|nr:winged helix-turn-helix transcriptional regulator [Pseudomonadales bacterium]
MNTPKNQNPNQAQLAVQVHELSLDFSKLFNRRVKHLGLTRAQWQVLRALYSKDGRTQTQLADELTMATPPMGKIIDKLEAGKWVVRKPDPRDRRKNRVFLTSKIDPLIGPLRDSVEDLRKIATQGMTKIEQKQLHRLLSHLKVNLEDELK